MNFKSFGPSLSDSEFRDFYRRTVSRLDRRPTDLNEASINKILQKLPDDAKNLLEIGAGRGYLLRKIYEARPDLDLAACDIAQHFSDLPVTFKEGMLEHLPYPEKCFDVVICCHTLEHCRDLTLSIQELKRVTRKLLVVVVPRQKYFRYTLDLHLHFFPTAKALAEKLGTRPEKVELVDGDWFCMISLSQNENDSK